MHQSAHLVDGVEGAHVVVPDAFADVATEFLLPHKGMLLSSFVTDRGGTQFWAEALAWGAARLTPRDVEILCITANVSRPMRL